MKGIQIDEETGELKIRGGDGRQTLSIGDTTGQNQYYILTAHKGEYKQWPVLGVGIGDYPNDDNGELKLKYNIRDSYKQDGLRRQSLSISEGKLQIEARYDRG